MSTSCTTIATRIIGKRPSNDSRTMMYYINDSFFANLNVLPYVESTVITFPLKVDTYINYILWTLSILTL